MRTSYRESLEAPAQRELDLARGGGCGGNPPSCAKALISVIENRKTGGDLEVGAIGEIERFDAKGKSVAFGPEKSLVNSGVDGSKTGAGQGIAAEIAEYAEFRELEDFGIEPAVGSATD